MTFLDKVKDNIVEFLRPGVRGELAALRQLYDGANAGNLQPNTWYQVLNVASAKLVGFSFVCRCMREFQLPHPHEWIRDYNCSQCRTKFHLYKDNGIVDAEGNFKVRASDIERILGELPIRPRLDGARRPNYVDTWDNSNSDVSYEPFTPSGLMGR
jgi:hypothetical protein